MNRNEIAETLRQWIAEGKMFSAAMLNKSGMSPHDQGRKCASGELLPKILSEGSLRNGCMVKTNASTQVQTLIP